MNNIGAYLQIYNNPEKSELCLSRFRKFYKDSPIYIVSDHGNDFCKMAMEYNCFYEHSIINTGVVTGGFSKEQFLIWIERMRSCFERCKSEYILYLEDDVFIRRPIDLEKAIKKDSVIAGVNGGHSIPWPVLNYLGNIYNIKYPINIGGACGGTLYLRSVFLSLYDNFIDVIEKHFDYLKKIWFNIGCLDQMMPILYMTYGYRYDFNRELYEPLRNPSWRNQDWSIFHFNGADENLIIKELKERYP